jgi:hypothetical protein
MTPQGHPARSNPGQIIGPNEAVVLMRRTRAYFIKARTHRWSIERPDIYTQPCIVVHRVTRRRCTEGWVYISFCASILHKQTNSVEAMESVETQQPHDFQR